MCRQSNLTALGLRAALVFTTVACAALFLTSPVVAQPGPPPVPSATITVDCDTGGTLANALSTRAESLVIEFSGTCAEELVITRDRLTIRGLDASAVVTDDPATPGSNPTLLLQGADVVFQSFTVEGSTNRGIRVQRSSGVQLEDMTLRNNAATGLTVEESSSAHVINSSMTGNAFAGIAAWGNSNVTLTGSLDVSDNSVVGVLLSTGASFMNRGGTSITADNLIFGVGTQQGGTGLFPPVTAQNTQFGVVTFGGSHVGPVSISGAIVAIFVTNRGTYDGVVSLSASLNAIQLIDNSYAFLRGGTASAPTGIDSFNSVTEVTNVTFDGDLTFRFNAQSFFITSSTTGVVNCDPTALVGGSITCGAPLKADPSSLAEARATALPIPLPLQQPD